MLRLVRTCFACPEQYDAFLGEEQIGYMRLRHGHFRAEYRGEIVYEADPHGDGRFYEDEREFHLRLASLAILTAHGLGVEPLYHIEAKNPDVI